MMKHFFIALSVLLLPVGFTGCHYIQPPTAQVDYSALLVVVENLDKHAWEDCHFIINASSGEENQYAYFAGDIPGLQSKTVSTPQFIQKDGSRFIPIVTKASDFTIQCKTPIPAYTLTLE